MSGARSHYQAEKRYRRKNGEPLWGRLTLSLIRDGDDRPWFLVAMIEDVTRDKEAGAALERRVEERTREIERRRRVAEGLQEIMEILNSGSSLDAVLQSVAEQAVGILQAHAVSVFERQGDDLKLRAYTDREAGLAENVAFPLGKGPLGKAGLRAMMAAMPGVEHLGEVNDPDLALAVVREKRPSLVVLDADVATGTACELVRQIKVFDGGTRCLVLAESAAQQAEALAAGADSAPLKGYRAGQLFAGLERLLRNVG